MTARPQISALQVAMLAMMLRGNLTLKKNYWFMRRNPQWRKKPSNECQGSKLHTNLMKSSWNLFSYDLLNRREYHYGFCMYMVPLKKWAQYFPDSNFTSAISLCFKLSFDEGPIFTILYWKAVQGLKHIYVVKNTSSERINSLYFILSKPFLAFRGH